MRTHRLEAFSDGVLAIIITIMVLELRAPEGEEQATFASLLDAHLLPVFLSYVLSFIYIAIYWNNHHHLFSIVEHVSGGVLWANMHLLFWLSLIPFTTSWMGSNPGDSAPAALYGFDLIMASIAYYVLFLAIRRTDGADSAVAQVIGRTDRKGRISTALYAVAIVLAFVWTPAAYALYAVVALIWVVPDTRIERRFRATA